MDPTTSDHHLISKMMKNDGKLKLSLNIKNKAEDTNTMSYGKAIWLWKHRGNRPHVSKMAQKTSFKNIDTKIFYNHTWNNRTHDVSNSCHHSYRPRRTTLGTDDLPTRTQKETLSHARTLSWTHTAHSWRTWYHRHYAIYPNTAFISPICQTKDISYVLIPT